MFQVTEFHANSLNKFVKTYLSKYFNALISIYIAVSSFTYLEWYTFSGQKSPNHWYFNYDMWEKKDFKFSDVSLGNVSVPS